MSTRAQIRVIFNGYPLNLYHHWDGYFSGVGKDLADMIKIDRRKEDDSYDLLEKFMQKLSEHISYEPTFFQHFDIEYFYLLDFDKMEFSGWMTKGIVPWKDEDENENEKERWYEQMPEVVEDSKIDLLTFDFDSIKE